ncbi:Uncharacterized protein APZ42_017801 [Daphnia magna]|uniref:Uncharacterized protein n=1 Tax=Daphnia magna TaxID=35525 RepID=A0A164ZJA3_9CRUS|nr:Uncharacterized protein APZ42_017801 [Daphnia magna]
MAIEPCLGGRSLRGLTELSEHDHTSTTTVSCCDESVCHGGLALKNEDRASFIINNPFGYSKLKHQYAQLVQSNHGHDAAQRHKRSTNGGRCVENKMACLPIEIRCCSANMSVFFPISAISALTGCRTGNDARRSNKFRFQRAGIISRTGHGGERLLVSAQSRTS